MKTTDEKEDINVTKAYRRAFAYRKLLWKYKVCS